MGCSIGRAYHLPSKTEASYFLVPNKSHLDFGVIAFLLVDLLDISNRPWFPPHITLSWNPPLLLSLLLSQTKPSLWATYVPWTDATHGVLVLMLFGSWELLIPY